MDNIKDDRYYLEKILKDLRFLIEHTGHLTEETIGEDEVLLDSILFRLIQISENAANYRRISKLPAPVSRGKPSADCATGSYTITAKSI